MSESTSNFSLYDLILRVALAAGVAYYGSDGSERAMIPNDSHDFEKCLRVVNDGIKTFIADAPENGWRWMNRMMRVTLATVETTGTVDSGSTTTLVDDALSSTYDADDDVNGYYVYDKTKEIYAVITDYATATGTVTVAEWLDYDGNPSSSTPASGDSYSITNLQTAEGDKARYPLSQDFMGDTAGKITYEKDSNRGHIVSWVHENFIRTLREVVVHDSHPTRAAVRPWRDRRWELIVDPSPTQADVLVFPYRVGFDSLQMISDIASGGSDTTLVDSGLANLYPDDYFNGWYAYIISGTGKTSYAKVTDYTSSSGTFTVADWLFANGTAGGVNPAANSVYYVEPVANKHPAGMQFDSIVMSAILAQAETEFEGLQLDYSPMQKYLEKDLPAAHRIDARSAPRRLGKMLPGSGRIYTEEHIRNDVTTSMDF